MSKKVEINYGLSCGRNWIEIDGKMIYQADGADLYMKDEDVAKLIKVLCDPDWKVHVFDENYNIMEWEPKNENT
jgi:hypothetical protein